MFKNEILLELFIFSLFFGIVLYFRFDEIGWIEMVFCKYVIILNILIIFLFFDCLEGIKEIFCFFFNNFWFLVDFLVGFEFRWSFDYLLEKKEWMVFVEF